KANSKVESLINKAGSWRPLVMNTAADPFTDVRVRQAFRLIADRPQMITSALGGQATLGNDVFGLNDPAYSGDTVPQRQQDIEQAKSLLKQAGQSNLKVKMTTSEVAAGLVEASTVFAQEAKKAGVTVVVDKVPTSAFFGPKWLSYPFTVDYWQEPT